MTHFSTVEINASFYRLQKAESFRYWRDAAPPGFVYAVKASRFITHMKRLKAEPESLRCSLSVCASWGRRLVPSSISCRQI